MSQPWLTILILAAGLWAAVILCVSAVLTRLVKLARRDCWGKIHRLIPAADLAGTWLGTIGCVALAFGRQGYTAAWAGCMGILAVMITVSLYDRAVLMPSLDAAFKRLEAGEPGDKWESEWRFLWRMSAIGRLLLLLGAAGALLLALLRFSA